MRYDRPGLHWKKPPRDLLPSPRLRVILVHFGGASACDLFFSSCGFLRTFKTWAQNGRKTPAFWAQIKGWLVSNRSLINVDFAEDWGGRWDLNPRLSVPQTDALPAELLPPLLASLA